MEEGSSPSQTAWALLGIHAVEPGHPAANEEGYVKMPDIEVINEMVDMMSASRAYEANTVAISSAKQMAKDALDI